MKKKKGIVLVVWILIVLLMSTLFACGGISVGQNGSEKQATDKTKEEEKEPAKPTGITGINLSETDLELGLGEEYELTAYVSPSGTNDSLSWSSSNTNVVSIDYSGTRCTVLGESEGSAVITAESSNGVIAICRVKVMRYVGSVTGTITYKYNNYVGNRADTGAQIILIRAVENPSGLIKDFPKWIPDEVGLGLTYGLEDIGIYSTEVDGAGQYRFDNIPIGKYHMVLISRNTNDNSSSVQGIFEWGLAVYYMFETEKGQENAALNAKVYKTRSKDITVEANKETVYSYDFGITYI